LILPDAARVIIGKMLFSLVEFRFWQCYYPSWLFMTLVFLVAHPLLDLPSLSSRALGIWVKGINLSWWCCSISHGLSRLQAFLYNCAYQNIFDTLDYRRKLKTGKAVKWEKGTMDRRLEHKIAPTFHFMFFQMKHVKTRYNRHWPKSVVCRMHLILHRQW
jgi:hypothetical protein